MVFPSHKCLLHPLYSSIDTCFLVALQLVIRWKSSLWKKEKDRLGVGSVLAIMADGIYLLERCNCSLTFLKF